MAEVTPITLLIGLPGAGKTTLLTHLLRQSEMAGVAVVTAQPDPPMWWGGGCPCCAPRDDVARALRTMLPRARRDEVRRVVIETTGMADPGPILATLLSDTVAASAYRLDAIVTVVDAVNGATALDTRDMAVRQVAAADRIVLSKTEPGDDPALRARLRRINPAAQIVAMRPDRGIFTLPALAVAACPPVLLGGGLSGPAPDLQGWVDVDAFAAVAREACPDGPAGRDARIRAFCLTFGRALARDEVMAWLEHLVLLHGDALLRMKAVLQIQGEDRPVAIHSAGHLLFPPVPLAAWPKDDPRNSRLVFITRDLPRSAVEAELAAFVDAPAIG
jgi:G3E family GTPase